MDSTKFDFTDDEFIKLANLILKLDASSEEETAVITSMADTLDLGLLDSLGITIFFIWTSELFGIKESKIEEFMQKRIYTIQAIKDFIMVEATRGYTLAEAEEYTRRCF